MNASAKQLLETIRLRSKQYLVALIAVRLSCPDKSRSKNQF